MRMYQENYYLILGLNPDGKGSEKDAADDNEARAYYSESAIKKAYHKKALKLHPDKNEGEAEQFKKLKDAYDFLSDAENRQRYHQELEQNPYILDNRQIFVEFGEKPTSIFDEDNAPDPTLGACVVFKKSASSGINLTKKLELARISSEELLGLIKSDVNLGVQIVNNQILARKLERQQQCEAFIWLAIESGADFYRTDYAKQFFDSFSRDKEIADGFFSALYHYSQQPDGGECIEALLQHAIINEFIHNLPLYKLVLLAKEVPGYQSEFVKWLAKNKQPSDCIYLADLTGDYRGIKEFEGDYKAALSMSGLQSNENIRVFEQFKSLYDFIYDFVFQQQRVELDELESFYSEMEIQQSLKDFGLGKVLHLISAMKPTIPFDEDEASSPNKNQLDEIKSAKRVCANLVSYYALLSNEDEVTHDEKSTLKSTLFEVLAKTSLKQQIWTIECVALTIQAEITDQQQLTDNIAQSALEHYLSLFGESELQFFFILIEKIKCCELNVRQRKTVIDFLLDGINDTSSNLVNFYDSIQSAEMQESAFSLLKQNRRFFVGFMKNDQNHRVLHDILLVKKFAKIWMQHQVVPHEDNIDMSFYPDVFCKEIEAYTRIQEIILVSKNHPDEITMAGCQYVFDHFDESKLFLKVQSTDYDVKHECLLRGIKALKTADELKADAEALKKRVIELLDHYSPTQDRERINAILDVFVGFKAAFIVANTLPGAQSFSGEFPNKLSELMIAPTSDRDIFGLFEKCLHTNAKWCLKALRFVDFIRICVLTKGFNHPTWLHRISLFLSKGDYLQLVEKVNLTYHITSLDWEKIPGYTDTQPFEWYIELALKVNFDEVAIGYFKGVIEKIHSFDAIADEALFFKYTQLLKLLSGIQQKHEFFITHSLQSFIDEFVPLVRLLQLQDNKPETLESLTEKIHSEYKTITGFELYDIVTQHPQWSKPLMSVIREYHLESCYVQAKTLHVMQEKIKTEKVRFESADESSKRMIEQAYHDFYELKHTLLHPNPEDFLKSSHAQHLLRQLVEMAVEFPKLAQFNSFRDDKVDNLESWFVSRLLFSPIEAERHEAREVLLQCDYDELYQRCIGYLRKKQCDVLEFIKEVQNPFFSNFLNCLLNDDSVQPSVFLEVAKRLTIDSTILSDALSQELFKKVMNYYLEALDEQLVEEDVSELSAVVPLLVKAGMDVKSSRAFLKKLCGSSLLKTTALKAAKDSSALSESQCKVYIMHLQTNCFDTLTGIKEEHVGPISSIIFKIMHVNANTDVAVTHESISEQLKVNILFGYEASNDPCDVLDNFNNQTYQYLSTSISYDKIKKLCVYELPPSAREICYEYLCHVLPDDYTKQSDIENADEKIVKSSLLDSILRRSKMIWNSSEVNCLVELYHRDTLRLAHLEKLIMNEKILCNINSPIVMISLMFSPFAETLTPQEFFDKFYPLLDGVGNFDASQFLYYSLSDYDNNEDDNNEDDNNEDDNNAPIDSWFQAELVNQLLDIEVHDQIRQLFTMMPTLFNFIESDSFENINNHVMKPIDDNISYLIKMKQKLSLFKDPGTPLYYLQEMMTNMKESVGKCIVDYVIELEQKENFSAPELLLRIYKALGNIVDNLDEDKCHTGSFRSIQSPSLQAIERVSRYIHDNITTLNGTLPCRLD